MIGKKFKRLNGSVVEVQGFDEDYIYIDDGQFIHPVKRVLFNDHYFDEVFTKEQLATMRNNIDDPNRHNVSGYLNRPVEGSL